MPRVMAVAFEPNGRLYYLDPGAHHPRVGDHVLIPTESGDEVATCVWAPEWVEADGYSDLPVCGGIATDDDLTRDRDNRQIRAQAWVIANRLIRDHGLPMSIVGVDYVDRSADVDRQVVVYFRAPHRVDFRALVSDLARTLQARIDLRQVGARDAAQLIGGVGHCGRDLCCATFAPSFDGISIRLAEAQGLPTNPLKISGACGRLMCCLKYEHPLYVDFFRQAPSVGTPVTVAGQQGRVVDHVVPADAVVVRMTASGEVTACPRADVCPSRAAYKSR